jgi:hypothetical protein
MLLTHEHGLIAKMSKGCVVLIDGIVAVEVTSTEVKVDTVCQYHSPTSGLTRVDCNYHNEYSLI